MSSEGSEPPGELADAAKALESGGSEASRRATLLALIGRVRDDHPDSQSAARLIIRAERRGHIAAATLRTKLIKAAKTTREEASRSARLLLDALRAQLGDEEAIAALEERLNPAAPELYNGIALDRLLTAIDWLRRDELVKSLKRLKRRLEGSSVSSGAIESLNVIREFLKSQRKSTKTQREHLVELFERLELDRGKVEAMLAPLGVRVLDELRSHEAKALVERLNMTLRASGDNRITPRQLSYVRKLIKKAGFDDEVLKMLAQEAGGTEDIRELDKEQASVVIDYLVGKTGGKR